MHLVVVAARSLHNYCHIPSFTINRNRGRYLILNNVCGIVWCDNTFGLLLGIALSISVFLTYCVFQDAYFSINDGKYEALIVTNTLGMSHLWLGIKHIADGDIIQNGIVTDNAIWLLFFAVTILLNVFVFIRKRRDKQSA